MKVINAELLKEFRKDFEEKMKEIECKYGIVINAKNITYSDDEFKMTIEAKVSSGDKEEDQKREFEKYCTKFGFSKDDYGSSLVSGSKKYKFIGFEPSKRKNSCKIEDESGQVFVCSPEYVKRALNDRSEKKHDCEHCKYAVMKTGAYTGEVYIECGKTLAIINNPDFIIPKGISFNELMKMTNSDCSFVEGLPTDLGVTFDD